MGVIISIFTGLVLFICICIATSLPGSCNCHRKWRKRQHRDQRSSKKNFTGFITCEVSIL